MHAQEIRICLIGLGPRGLAVLERLCANRPVGRRLSVYLVDPHLGSGGRTWHTGVSPLLVMNTVAEQVSMFTDRTVDCAGPIRPGPSLAEWAGLPPGTYASRACYGRYLDWFLRQVIGTAPADVGFRRHPVLAVDLSAEADGRQRVHLADGTVLSGLDAVVLAQGHLGQRPDRTELALAEFARRYGLTYVPPGNPAEVDLDVLAPGQAVALRGMGLCFFDYLSLLTVGRGGRFSREQGGRLRYHESGREPRLVAGCRRGVPHHARAVNQKGAAGRHEPVFLTAERVAKLRARAGGGTPLRFREDIWPELDREVRAVYHGTYLARSGLAEPPPWDWHRLADPSTPGHLGSARTYRDWLLSYVDDDVLHARRGNRSGPRKAALDVLRDLRNELRELVEHGGLTAESWRSELRDWFNPLNAFLAVGPPLERVEELGALIRAGVVEVVGPRMRVACEPGEFVIHSALPEAHPVRALVEARLPVPDLRRTRDPLLRNLFERGEAALHRLPLAEGGHLVTGGLAVTRRPCHLLDAAGGVHPRRFAFGVPTEGAHWLTAAGIRPFAASVILADADAIARACLPA
ncbi:FAD/NAD(P)-binding protein [Crossiella cryophila]|uniref:Putative NAD(P)/FAD-binding protein YdhS n=1 Tax=Crossiella cryophila TaxID=43355 RepID=A0A7W7FYT8_9PSEU|nr:FAD/NAD(P)-binding protein [Crossiella cryophila]MBB4680409.1 putative NAD(P)/FAD-binding protein YdhS [Crossiella cryophila]